MTFNQNTYQITISQYDWGVPVVFEAGTLQGFQISDEIVFCFDIDSLNDKPYVVDNEKYSFEFKFEEEEANALYDHDIRGYTKIRYSIKRKRNGVFLESLENEKGDSVFDLIVKGTVRENGKVDSTQSSES